MSGRMIGDVGMEGDYINSQKYGWEWQDGIKFSPHF